MPPNELAADVGSILAEHLDDVTDRLVLVNPDGDAVTRTVELLDARAEPPRVALLAARDLLKDVTDDFLVASRAANLVERDALALRSVENPPNQSLLVTADRVTALVPVADGVGALHTDDREFVEGAGEYYDPMVAAADPFDLRTPPLFRIRESMTRDLGDDVATDFDAVFASLDAARTDGVRLDAVTITLLVAARNGALLYDVSKWGEDVGLASKATFSRTKTALEDAGLVATEKVPIEVGRPRLRLLLGDERLAAADPGEMATRASQILNG